MNDTMIAARVIEIIRCAHRVNDAYRSMGIDPFAAFLEVDGWSDSQWEPYKLVLDLLGVPWIEGYGDDYDVRVDCWSEKIDDVAHGRMTLDDLRREIDQINRDDPKYDRAAEADKLARRCGITTADKLTNIAPRDS